MTHGRFTAAFSLVELIAVVFVLIVLGGLATVCVFHAKRMTSLNQCTSNLRRLGVATTTYIQQNGGNLPYAFIKYSDNEDESSTWDALIYPFAYRTPGKTVSSSSLQETSKLFQCPSDKFSRYSLAPRSYAMNYHSMVEGDWPFGTNGDTGVGLWWSSEVTNGPAALENVLSSQRNLPSIQISSILTPADTLLLAELSVRYNFLFASSGAATSFVENLKTKPLHGRKCNYLLLDGHVEVHNPSQTRRIWTTEYKIP